MFCESFTDKVIEHFMCPRNVGSMLDANAEGTCGLPENKMHCSVLGATALKNAIENYYKKLS